MVPSVPMRRSSERLRMVSNGTIKSTGIQNAARKISVGDLSPAPRLTSMSE